MTAPSPAETPSGLAQNVSLQFASRPTFEQQAQRMLEQAIRERYPTLAFDLSQTQLATPDATARGWKLRPLMAHVLDYLALGTPVNFSDADGLPCFLTQKMPHPFRSGEHRLDMKIIEKLVLELPWSVPIGLEDGLTRYWNEAIDPDTHADKPAITSRWRWLSDVLRNALQVRGLQQPDLTEAARQALDQIVRWPEHEQRFARQDQSPVNAYSLATTITQGTSTTLLVASELLLRYVNEGTSSYLLCGPAGAVQAFESLDAFTRHWSERIAGRYVADTLSCQRSEIEGNAFDTQAAMILEQQLTDVKAVQLPSRIGLDNLKALYRDLSDPARYLLDAPHLPLETSVRLEPLLPGWLKNASIVDQTMFQHYSLALARAKKRNQGRTYLSDIQDIKAFSADVLSKWLLHLNASHAVKVDSGRLQPNDIQLTFTVGAGYPGTIGIIEKTRMSLTELAIKNLVARPSGNLAISHRLGLALPTWLTADFITRKGGLIEQVDIGTAYPRYLQQHLLDDVPVAQERERLFAEQIPAQLPLEALEQVLNHENGMTREGLQLVEALLMGEAAGHRAGGRTVAIRHLALLREPKARPDIVHNMFIIEPLDAASGPRLLYRPLYAPTLQQFATRQALLQAIVAAGELQHSVLTWMSDTARPIYANGGFVEPHIRRFLQGDQFEQPDKPAPATLATLDVDGELMQSLYYSAARALVNQADRESVSNSESRWAVFLEGTSLLFNTLLAPLLRGPIVTVAWLWSLMASASHDLPALSSEDPVARELAGVDLLLNLGLLVGHLPSTRAPVRTPLPERVMDQAMQPPAPRLIPEQWPLPAPPKIVEAAEALPGAPSTTHPLDLDLGFASARYRLTPRQLSRLRDLRVPSPAPLPEPIKYGPYTGLYVIRNTWHALVEDHLYQVSPEPDGSATIVDPFAPKDPERNGPPLRADRQGNWSLDLRLRLLGGAPPKRVKAQRDLNLERRLTLQEEFNQVVKGEEVRNRALQVAQEVMIRLEEGGNYTEAQRAAKRKVFYDLLQEQTDLYLKLVNSAPERTSLGIEISPADLRGILENVVNNARKAVVVIGNQRTVITNAHPEFQGETYQKEAVVTNLQEYLKYLDTLSDLNDQTIHWLELKDDFLERLLNLDEAGAQAFERLTRDRPIDEINAISSKAMQFVTLPMLSVKNSAAGLSESLLRIVVPLGEQVRSHCELRMYELPAAEQLEVLTSLTEQYGKSLDALQGIKTLYPNDLNEAYFDRLLKLVESLYQEVSGKLAAEIKPEPKPRRRAPKQSRVPAGRPQKKVIRTRNSGVLIGDLKPAGTALPIEVVELRFNDTLLSTYSRHDDVWDAVDIRKPTPAPKTRSVKAIKGDARKLLGELDERLRHAESYKKHCRHPQEIEEIMNNEASRFRKLSEELDRAFAAAQTQPTPADQALSKQLSDAIASLTTRGSALRTELSLQLPPTDGNLRFLFEKQLIQVARLGERKALKGARKDFLQEYTINDRDGFALWYAHFHYETAETPKADYSVAHLKTKEQRREHYHSLLDKADSPYAVVNVHRGQLSKSLAQSKFLSLAP